MLTMQTTPCKDTTKKERRKRPPHGGFELSVFMRKTSSCKRFFFYQMQGLVWNSDSTPSCKRPLFIPCKHTFSFYLLPKRRNKRRKPLFLVSKPLFCLIRVPCMKIKTNLDVIPSRPFFSFPFYISPAIKPCSTLQSLGKGPCSNVATELGRSKDGELRTVHWVEQKNFVLLHENGSSVDSLWANSDSSMDQW